MASVSRRGQQLKRKNAICGMGMSTRGVFDDGRVNARIPRSAVYKLSKTYNKHIYIYICFTVVSDLKGEVGYTASIKNDNIKTVCENAAFRVAGTCAG